LSMSMAALATAGPPLPSISVKLLSAVTSEKAGSADTAKAARRALAREGDRPMAAIVAQTETRPL